MRSAFMTLALAFAISLMASSAMAQSPEQAAKLQDIKSLIAIQQSQENFGLMLDNSLSAMRKAFPKDNSGLMEEFFTEFRNDFSFDVLVGRLNDALIPVYDKNFSHEEIKELIKFNGSPLGKKLIMAQPEIQKASTTIGMELGREIAQKAMAKVQQRRAAEAAAKKAQEQPQEPKAQEQPAPQK